MMSVEEGEDRPEMDKLETRPVGKATVQGGNARKGESAQLGGEAQHPSEAKGEAFSKGRRWSASPNSPEKLWRKKTERTPGFGAQDCCGGPKGQRSALARLNWQEGMK